METRPHIVGNRTRKFREKVGFSADAVASNAGIPEQDLKEIEAGKRPASAWQLHRVARALGTVPEIFLGDEGVGGDPARAPARFRTASAFGVNPAPQDVRALSVAAEVGRVGAALMRLPGRGLHEALRPDSTPFKASMEDWEHGYELGERARLTFFRDGQVPIVSVQAALESIGIHVAVVEFQDDMVEGASVFERDALPIILLNSRCEKAGNPRARRALLAHELCHLLHDATSRHIVTTITRRDYDHTQREERRANAFSPAFLAPPRWLGRSEPRELGMQLVLRWGFTAEGAAWHVKNIHRLAESATLNLMNDLRSLQPYPPVDEEVVHQQRTLPTAPSALTRGVVGGLVRDALEAGEITRSRAIEILEMS